MELEKDLASIRQRGLGLAAISYDSEAILRSFADRQHITFPLLSDPESKIIKAFGIFNETSPAGTMFYGIPYPGTFVVDPQGKVVSKYFEDDYRERFTASDILDRQFGAATDSGRSVVAAKHLNLIEAAGTAVARPGQRIVLSLELELPPKMHVYAPGVQGYIPIEWKLEAGGPAAKQHPFEYPPSQKLRLEAIHETVPVYRDRVVLSREITFGPEAALRSLVTPEGELVVKGSFRYQACDDKICYTPETVPVQWRFHFEGLDRQRAPSELQRKSGGN